MNIGAVVLAAGQGTRMRSAVPKVAHPIAGRPMVAWVLDALSAAGATSTVVVVGHGAEAVREALPPGVAVAVQEPQNGTGDAARVGLDALDPACDTVIVACGDTPLLDPALLGRLVEEHGSEERAATVVTAVLDDAGSYGRVVRDAEGRVARIVEARDASARELEIREFNAGLYAVDREALRAALGGLDASNAQGELYLTDAIGALGGVVAPLVSDDPEVASGINDRVDLAACEAAIQRRLREELMRAGVTMPDPSAVYVDAGVTVGADTVLYPGTHLRGDTAVAGGCTIGPDAVIVDSVIGPGSTVVSAQVRESQLGDGCIVGPFAQLRPGCRLERGARAGSFVELKSTVLGPGAKVPHLSYVGDAAVGEETNIGAGNITANYDGFRKHRTTIGARVKTGSDCVFVAPVSVGDDAMTGAGSIITDDVPAGALGIARARQTVIEGFTERASARAREAAEGKEGSG
ncbi:MAG TPA: bifunctional UDP-N-acetylglucosamine diphosphorylase/glucosamine-1-phosphate N-acetyltransferase GlmU [Miltoncostaeaceae bacterium]|jgi:bifunctional UDP-N-acetylglucosamine pyrophosphorylase/glucosamine-1-phosphate N-acetyltransferase|nr:bifunctional UDP-N-acetylglucosamine diphosphorylase/glucosamine-1-phosphate N-acetyltransferase GlmU [Miltoncostaeaceae bacterium]